MTERLVALARALALLFFGAAGAYLFALVALAQLALRVTQSLDSSAARLALGVLVLDVGKLVGLLPAAWFVGGRLSLRPAIAAPLLVGLTFTCELLVMLVVQQAEWTWSQPLVWGSRLAVALLLVWPVWWVLARRYRPASGGGSSHSV